MAFLIIIEFHKFCEALRRLRMQSNATANIRNIAKRFRVEFVKFEYNLGHRAAHNSFNSFNS